ncbi:cytokine receptor common subunit beta isoform X2 [Plectropomus leopardus]|uniref:cytokine receptor common subunit beta isoform X2 n=1 Tax=Plectropomus leopardus TaxID=160734 RepID=UPI001C4BF039|nr:cytokine receptor common subunit beta isoform X2 [Plectropomus leopardus]
MMPLVWVVLWPALPLLVLSCEPDCCSVHESRSSQNLSPLLKSLKCHNDYESHVLCRWSECRNTSLQLWFETTNSKQREQCVPYGAEVQDASGHRTVQCRYNTRIFSIGIKHTVFFLENKTLNVCSSVPHAPLDLSQHLRARPPVNLSIHGGGDGGRRLSWSSPYPSSSPLNRNITYQLSYRTNEQDNWTSEDVTNTSVTLEKPLLLPGRTYEAKVRARVSVGQWSDWSPVVTWHSEEDTGQFPSLHCVLDGEKEVLCSWEVSREVAHFITYQLACRHNQTAPSERCCVNPTVSSDLSRAVLRYSCSLTVADPAHLLIHFLPARNAKSFKADQHIRPNPPQQVNVRRKDSNWIVEWTEPSTAAKLSLYYQVCYYRTQDPESFIMQNTSEGSMYLSILGASLAPSQDYQVKVRSLVFLKDYGGIPSEWTDPVDWTSLEAAWSLTTLIYFAICMLVAAVFLTLYCTIPACRRRAVLWVDSVPSPGKSKILSEIKSASSRKFMQCESTSVCKVQHLDSVSTCSSDASLWLTKDTDKQCLEQDEGCWQCDNLPSPAEKSSEPSCKSADIEFEETEEEEPPSDDSACFSPVTLNLYGEGCVCLPNRSVSRSTQDLVSHSDTNTNTHRQDSAAVEQKCPERTEIQMSLSEPPSSPQPPDHTSGPFTPWPQGGSVQASGYCQLPTAFMRAAE